MGGLTVRPWVGSVHPCELTQCPECQANGGVVVVWAPEAPLV